jgi:hypothetical protein
MVLYRGLGLWCYIGVRLRVMVLYRRLELVL